MEHVLIVSIMSLRPNHAKINALKEKIISMDNVFVIKDMLEHKTVLAFIANLVQNSMLIVKLVIQFVMRTKLGWEEDAYASQVMLLSVRSVPNVQKVLFMFLVTKSVENHVLSILSITSFKINVSVEILLIK